MNQMAFSSRWCGWIDSCLKLSRSSMLVNGSPTRTFVWTMERDVWQAAVNIKTEKPNDYRKSQSKKNLTKIKTDGTVFYFSENGKFWFNSIFEKKPNRLLPIRAIFHYSIFCYFQFCIIWWRVCEWKMMTCFKYVLMVDF